MIKYCLDCQNKDQIEAQKKSEINLANELKFFCYAKYACLHNLD